jgi:hypothetical protein
MTDLTEKNLENVLLNLTKTDKPIAIKPTTWFGNPAKIAQWYTCPNCAKQSPLTLEWIGLTDEEIKEGESKEELGHGFIQGALWAEATLKEKNT